MNYLELAIPTSPHIDDLHLNIKNTLACKLFTAAAIATFPISIATITATNNIDYCAFYKALAEQNYNETTNSIPIKSMILKIKAEVNNKEKNRIIIRFINDNFHNTDLLSLLLKKLNGMNFHPSIIKSALVMTQSIDVVNKEWRKLDNYLSDKMAAKAI